jgi:hypothetical protein
VRIIPALFLIATKCRLGNLRHQATSLLLTGQRREGIWDSCVSGRVAEWIVGLEEQAFGLGRGVVGEVIPEDMRVWGEVISRDLEARRAGVRCRQNIPGYPGVWKETATVVHW